jgi:hypothetical protein
VTAYTTPAALEAYLGVTFTPEQATQAAAVCDAVTAFIDRYCARTWQTVSPITAEIAQVLPTSAGWYHYYGVAYLEHRPVESVTAVSLRTAYPNAELSSLDLAEFELLDPANGALSLVVSPWYGDPRILAVVDYLYSDAVPADITLAATMIAAATMQASMTTAAGSAIIAANPQLAGLESISVGQNDVNVTLSKAATAGASGMLADGSSWVTPGSAAAAILDGYRRVVIS